MSRYKILSMISVIPICCSKVRLKQQKSGFKTTAPYIAERLSVSHAAHYLRAFQHLN